MKKCLFLSFCVLIIFSCKDSKEDVYKKGILGKWIVVGSELNNKPSKSMDKAFFTFSEDNKVTSNVLDGGASQYELKDEKISIKTTEPLELDISYFENDSMIMEGNYTMYYIKFFMKKDSL
ncbi:MAG: hypothetical protein WAT79_03685 [Saprospiraceae bacterium]